MIPLAEFESSYIRARRFGLTAHQHYALRVIAQLERSPTYESEIATVTLRALHRKGLIVHREARQARLGWVGVSEGWYEFKATDAGSALAVKLGQWSP